MWSNANVWSDSDTVAYANAPVSLNTGDWIALRRLGLSQSLTAEQVSRLLKLGLAQPTSNGVMCSDLGRSTLKSRP